MAGPWNGSPRLEFERRSHLGEPKSLPLQNLRASLVIFDQVPFDRQGHGSKLTIHFDLLGPQEMVDPFILLLRAIRTHHDHIELRASLVITPKYAVGHFLDRALPLTCTLVQLRSRSGAIYWMIIDIVKTEPEIELEDPQRTRFSEGFLIDVLVYDCSGTSPPIETYQEMRYAQFSIGIIAITAVKTQAGYR
jgi:hypothetical protein